MTDREIVQQIIDRKGKCPLEQNRRIPCEKCAINPCGFRLDTAYIKSVYWMSDNKEESMELKAGDKVWVSDESEEEAKTNKRERIFITRISGKMSFVCVMEGHEAEYPDGDFNVNTWKYAVPVLEASEVELTIEEIAEKFGIPASKLRIKK